MVCKGVRIYKRFEDIPKFPRIYYTVNVSWDYLDEYLESKMDEDDAKAGLSKLNMNPDFQRGHVWTRDQQIAYVEFILAGGSSGRHLYFNHPGWMGSLKGDYVLVDGLQRITAALAFLHNEIPAYGTLYKDYDDCLSSEADFIVNVAKLKTKKEVLDWYILMNTGGTPHSVEEIERVKRMKEELENCNN